MKTIAKLALGLALAASAAACTKTPKVADLPPTPGGGAVAQGSGGAARTGPVGNAVTPGSNADFMAQMNGRNVVFFDTDKSDLDSTDQAVLRAQAEWLLRYPNKRATLEGHCDERGTREYNIALGERRAAAAKAYLVSLGVSTARLSTISYGKERPVALGSNEQAWAQNRRAVTITID